MSAVAEEAMLSLSVLLTTLDSGSVAVLSSQSHVSSFCVEEIFEDFVSGLPVATVTSGVFLRLSLSVYSSFLSCSEVLLSAFFSSMVFSVAFELIFFSRSRFPALGRFACCLVMDFSFLLEGVVGDSCVHDRVVCFGVVFVSFKFLSFCG